jgi:two-component system chemotaxis sensor kinase CheA
MNLEQALQAFFAESDELLLQMEEALLVLEQQPADATALNAVFRAAHTIKGSAGLFGLDRIVGFAHCAESLLDKLRHGELTFNGDIAAALLASCDRLKEMTALAAECGNDQMLANDPEHGALMARLERLAGLTPKPVVPAAAPEPEHEVEIVEHQDTAASDCWVISIRVAPDILQHGIDPLSFMRYLTKLGTLVHVTTLTTHVPPLDALDPEFCHLAYEIAFRSDADKVTIEKVFEFMQEVAEVRILPPHSKLDDYIRLIQELPEDKLMLGEMLVASGVLTEQELATGLARQTLQQANEKMAPLGEILVQEQLVPQPVLDAALAKQQQARERKTLENRFIRVDSLKLEHLINLVGELVIAGAGANLAVQEGETAGMQEAMSVLQRLMEEIRDSALRLRMVEIGDTFQRFQRVVRDTAHELGKDIELVIDGGETELDKSMVEKINDPLLHLVRNAIDHGIEPVDTRLANGKPARAKVMLSAQHESGSVLIKVSDDGGGLNRDRILARAIERGLAKPDQALKDSEIYGFIFEPGFSTAAAVTNLSGRGVGMDVVKKNISALRGSIDIDTKPGAGTTVSIRLPLTLAIIDGFMIGVGSAAFVVPLDSVIECVDLNSQICDRDAHTRYINLRGETLPYLALSEFFGIEPEADARQSVVVVQYGERKAGLVVDRLHGEYQTVIKPLGSWFSHLKGIAGSTILGTGAVGLIIDVPTLVDLARERESNDLERLDTRFARVLASQPMSSAK